MRSHYIPGEWNAICQRCGFQYKASALRQEWTGVRVCSHCWEPRHPADLIQTTPDHSSTPWALPEAVDSFVGTTDTLTAESDNGSGDITFMLLAEDGSILLSES